MNALRLVLALSPLEEDAVAEALYGSDAVDVVASGADANELLAIAASETAEAVLLSAALIGLDAGVTSRLHAHGLRLAGLLLDAANAGSFAGLDLDAVIEPPFTGTELVQLVNGSATTVDPRPPLSAVSRRPERPAREGSVLAVIGGKGAPGASELACSFAALVGRSWPVLLAECDGDGGQLALRLGIDPRQGSLLGPARALNTHDPNAASLLPRWLVGGERGWPDVLVGLPDPPTDLAELNSPGMTEQLLAMLTGSFPMVVCDVGHRLRSGIEPDPAVRLHRELLTGADAVLLVLGSRQEQLNAGLAQIELLVDELGIAPQRLRIVVNGQGGPGAAATLDTGRAIGPELARFELSVDAWLPWDAKALRASVRLGVPLALARPRGGYARAVSRLVSAVLLPSVPQPAVRKQRLRTPTPVPPVPAPGAGSRG